MKCADCGNDTVSNDIMLCQKCIDKGLDIFEIYEDYRLTFHSGNNKSFLQIINELKLVSWKND